MINSPIADANTIGYAKTPRPYNLFLVRFKTVQDLDRTELYTGIRYDCTAVQKMNGFDKINKEVESVES